MKILSYDAKNYILLSPFEFQHFEIELPPINKKYIANAVSLALNSKYPGNTETTKTDYWYSKTDDTLQVTSIAVNNETVKKYTEKAFPLLSLSILVKYISSLTKNTAKTGYFFVTPQWYESFIIENSTIFIHRIGSMQSLQTSEKQQSIVTDYHDVHSTVFITCADDLPPDVRKNVNSIFSSLRITSSKTIDDFLTPKALSILRVFNTENKNKKKNLIKVTEILLIILNLILIMVSLNSIVHNKNRKLEEIKTLYTEKKALALEIEKLKNNIASIKTSVQQKDTSNFIPVYEVLSEIYLVSDSKTRINSFILKNNEFQIEVKGIDALEFFEKMNNNPLFSDVMVHQVLPSLTDGDSFTISGKIKK